MFNIDFKNKPTNFFQISSFSKRKNLDNYQLLKQAFDQKVLPEDNKELLMNFINIFKDQKNFQSQIYQDICAILAVGENFDKTFLEFGATNGLEYSNTFSIEKYFNWTGVLAEPDPQWHKDLKKK